ncbi:DsbE family thiol:disulfide interchange protein [Phenylobacterium sp. SCN 70-31]|uniref:DsbE family thiol:disulfide interchange protein n=1 Tax=Phenylobacterium sp. SCN 70-31 TaxID=1660129 RepID=UPI00086A495C|nr:DsbE family thiol:disulfide interchange protein [Phenylobacterium sp. SCN 70-31]ODT89309.1 MAG: thiol:disulfide interchange protein [Phenylobacterium sp. SCN 70-31]
MTRWLAFLPLAALIALGGLFYFYALKRDPQVQPQALVGKPMPDLELPSLTTGQPVRLRALAADGPMLVNFFASWCAPCEVEHPVLMGARGQGVRIVGVAYKDAPTNSQAFLVRLGDPFAVTLSDRDGRAGVEFGVTGVPETYAVSADGVIQAKHTGPLTDADARRLAQQLR